MSDETTKQYPYKSGDMIWGPEGSSISKALFGGYHFYDRSIGYKKYKTFLGAWKAFCRFNDYPLNIEVN